MARPLSSSRLAMCEAFEILSDPDRRRKHDEAVGLSGRSALHLADSTITVLSRFTRLGEDSLPSLGSTPPPPPPPARQFELFVGFACVFLSSRHFPRGPEVVLVGLKVCVFRIWLLSESLVVVVGLATCYLPQEVGLFFGGKPNESRCC